MATVIFDNEVVRSHRLYALCGASLSAISERDYPGKNYFSEGIVALDLDSYEAEHAKGDKRKTVDAVIGVADYDERVRNGRLQLVELRLGYGNSDNLSAKELNGKINYSLSVLGGEFVVDKSVLFVFKAEVSHEAKRWMEAEFRSNKSHKEWVALSPAEFRTAISFLEDLPYIAKHDYPKVMEEIRDKLSSEDWDGYFRLMDFWGRKYFYYLQRYNHKEADLIKGMVRECFGFGERQVGRMGEEAQLCFELLGEDLQRVLCEE